MSSAFLFAQRNVCLCMSTRVYACPRVSVCVHTCLWVSTHVCGCPRMSVRVHACLWVSMRVSVCVACVWPLTRPFPPLTAAQTGALLSAADTLFSCPTAPRATGALPSGVGRGSAFTATPSTWSQQRLEGEQVTPSQAWSPGLEIGEPHPPSWLGVGSSAYYSSDSVSLIELTR